MNLTATQPAPAWSSRLTFLMAAVGAAVGLGNIWKFPYVAGVSGGGAFVLVYLLCAIAVAIPILIGELLIGRSGGHSPPLSMRQVAKNNGRSGAWSVVGWLGLITGYLIATYYSVIAGWTLDFTLRAANDFGGAGADTVGNQFQELLESPATMAAWHAVFMMGAMLIVGQGLQGGIERAVRVLMPALFVMLLAMIGYAAVAGDFGAGLRFLFRVDFSAVTGEVVLAAVGQAFFSIGVALGLMMAYGAYVPRSVSLVRSALIITACDTSVALLAGLMIFPLVFAMGLDPAEGPGLIFVTLPAAFAEMPGGAAFGALFFLLLAFAAVTSIIAILEPMVAYAVDRWHMRRSTACLVFGVLAWILGLATVFSFNIWAGFTPLSQFERFATSTLFDLLDYFTANVFMPLGGILIALFVGWRWPRESLRTALGVSDGLLFSSWLILLRFVAPAAIAAIMISNLF